MSIFRRGEPLKAAQAPGRYRIRIITEDGDVLYWHKRGQVHIVDEDVARIFCANFKPELFQAAADGSLQPPEPGRTRPIARVEMERV
ncbi:MAG: hypothetical protein O7J95_07430 [Planctomycetota bacterium]|nr:hypothetical protein [Planctomycetota bacterium]